jgi:hypothetical protein
MSGSNAEGRSERKGAGCAHVVTTHSTPDSQLPLELRVTCCRPRARWRKVRAAVWRQSSAASARSRLEGSARARCSVQERVSRCAHSRQSVRSEAERTWATPTPRMLALLPLVLLLPPPVLIWPAAGSPLRLGRRERCAHGARESTLEPHAGQGTSRSDQPRQRGWLAAHRPYSTYGGRGRCGRPPWRRRPCMAVATAGPR